MVDSALATARWRYGKWPEIAGRWEPLHDGALEFANLFGELRASTLVDKLKPLESMGSVDRDELKKRLDALHDQIIDVPAIRRQYLSSVQAFWDAAQSFFGLAEMPSANEAEIAASWATVRDAGARLKEMFSSGRIPEGVVLP